MNLSEEERTVVQGVRRREYQIINITDLCHTTNFMNRMLTIKQHKRLKDSKLFQIILSQSILLSPLTPSPLSPPPASLSVSA